ncbi:MAG: DUF2796 domain-containing protein [Bauldia sp.]|nr:DUF2796 domain-containing protein [Bauldia sp.]
MKRILTLGAVAVLSGLPAALAQPVERREVAEHVHGESAMHIAVEGNQMAIDFDATGIDIVGFEYVPATPEDQAAIDGALEKLRAPLPDLFDFGAAAGCSVTSAEVEFLVEDEEEAPGAAPGAPAGQVTNHTGFEGVYEITCANIGAITDVTFGFFTVFPNAEVIDVELASPRGQSTFDVEHENPVVSFAGLL